MSNAPSPGAATPAKKSGWLNLLVDYGPVLVFFLVYRYFSPENRDQTLEEVAAEQDLSHEAAEGEH